MITFRRNLREIRKKNKYNEGYEYAFHLVVHNKKDGLAILDKNAKNYILEENGSIRKVGK